MGEAWPRAVLITGGAGFLGCHLARRFLADGHAVTLLDVAPLTAHDLQGRVHYVQGDVRDATVVRQAVQGQDWVVHAAAALPVQRPRTIFDVNVRGTQCVLEACLAARVARAVFVSSTAVYGVPRHLPETEVTPLAPLGAYGQAKAAAERLCHYYSARGLAVNVLRPKTFLGPERLGVFALWFEAIRTGRRVFLLGDGRNRYQLLGVADLCDAVVRACAAPVVGETFNLGAREFGCWRDDLGAVIAWAGTGARLTPLPVRPAQLVLATLAWLGLAPLSAWHYRTVAVDSYVSSTKAEQLLGWWPAQTNRAVLLESYRWYAAHRPAGGYATGLSHRTRWPPGALRLLDWLA